MPGAMLSKVDTKSHKGPRSMNYMNHNAWQSDKCHRRKTYGSLQNWEISLGRSRIVFRLNPQNENQVSCALTIPDSDLGSFIRKHKAMPWVRGCQVCIGTHLILSQEEEESEVWRIYFQCSAGEVGQSQTRRGCVVTKQLTHLTKTLEAPLLKAAAPRCRGSPCRRLCSRQGGLSNWLVGNLLV